MRRTIALLGDPHSGSMVRYVVAGGTVGGVYLGIPLALTSLAGTPIEAAIPIAYITAVCLHFVLQRHFVFRHVTTFALTTREQVRRYVAVGAIQYPIVAITTGFLPGALGVSARVIYVCTTLTMSAIFFLVLRGHVFHAGAEQIPKAG